MGLEWAWLRSQQHVCLPHNEIVLDAEPACRVLLLHGLTGTPTEFAYVAHYLQRRAGVSVECRRLVNHGQPIGVLARTSWRDLEASAQEHFVRARDAARARREPLVVGGLSLGAVLALSLAAEHPRDVAGVIALAPTLFYDGWNVPWIRRLIGVADYMPFKHLLFLREDPPYGVKDAALRARIGSTYARASLRDSAAAAEVGYAHFPVALFCEMRKLIARCIERLPRVRAPLLIVQAREDDMTSPRNALFIRDRVASARKEIVLLENSYHLVTADLDRERAAAAMTRFCRELARDDRAIIHADD